MRYRKIILLFSILFLVKCTNTDAVVDASKTNFNNITFDVVSKKIIFKGHFPKRVRSLTQDWFDKRIKVDGLEGSMIFTVINYFEKETLIDNGKKIEVSLEFLLSLNKPFLLKKKEIKGKVKAYGEITGTFSLNDFDILKQNTQYDLILRLSNNLKSKI